MLALAFAAWSLLRQVWRSPATVGRYLYRRRQKRGLDALTSGIIAVGAGDRALAVRYAAQARKALPNEPLTHLLRAQAAQIGGDRATARRIFEAMLASPETEQLGLRGLFLEAEREGEQEAARQFAERALQRNPKLGWPVEALFELQCRAQDWQAALDTLAIARRQQLIDKAPAARRRAVLLTAQAQALEDTDADKALELAQEAHRLAPDLVPAAAIAGRVLAARGNTPRAARVLLKTWRLCTASRSRGRLCLRQARRQPARPPQPRAPPRAPHAEQSPRHRSRVAISAIDARDWDEARKALEPLLDDRLTPRVCTLMARIEGEQNSDAGRVREWLARAANAARDPAWTADGVVSDHWSAVSPVTGALDAFQWRAPVEVRWRPVRRVAGRQGRSAHCARGPPRRHGRQRHGRSRRRRRRPATVEPPRDPPLAAVAAATAPAGARRSRARSLAAANTVRPRSRRPCRTAQRTRGNPGTGGRSFPASERHLRRPSRSPRRNRRRRQPQPRARKPAEPKIFVPPHAPDDPGTEAADDDFSAFSHLGSKGVRLVVDSDRKARRPVRRAAPSS